MAYQRDEHLYHYDIFPKVVVAGKETVIHIRPLGGRRAFLPSHRYAAIISGMTGGLPDYYPVSADVTRVETVCNEDGSLDIHHTFKREQVYTIRMHDPERQGDTRRERFDIYCVAPDLAGLYPWMGDCHIHTCRSDGDETPEVVCANYRAHGYDFLAITDHGQYYPSLQALDFYKDVPTGLTIVPGEEVHMLPTKSGVIRPHIVNFGGAWSINALDRENYGAIVGEDWRMRALTPDCPPAMTHEEFEAFSEHLCAQADVPEGVDALSAEGIRWVCQQIRNGGGLAIYAHPNWVTEDVFHVPDALHDWLVENHVFDAFEVLGGDDHHSLEQQIYQTVRYYKDMARGYRYPVVGNTDSHSSLPTNKIAYIAATIVWAKKNECAALIQGIKDFHSIAIDNLDDTGDHFRLVGEERMVRYGLFLLRNYFPIHDEYCVQEGLMMKQYATGTPEDSEEALRRLTEMAHYVERHCRKYFDF